MRRLRQRMDRVALRGAVQQPIEKGDVIDGQTKSVHFRESLLVRMDGDVRAKAFESVVDRLHSFAFAQIGGVSLTKVALPVALQLVVLAIERVEGRVDGDGFAARSFHVRSFLHRHGLSTAGARVSFGQRRSGVVLFPAARAMGRVVGIIDHHVAVAFVLVELVTFVIGENLRCCRHLISFSEE